MEFFGAEPTGFIVLVWRPDAEDVSARRRLPGSAPAGANRRWRSRVRRHHAGLGGEAGRGLPELLREIGVEEPGIDAHVIALKPGHPYLRLPLQFSVALQSRLLETLSEDELASLRREAEAELAEPGRWGTTFTLIQTWGRL